MSPDLLENKPVVYCSKFTLCQQWHLTQVRNLSKVYFAKPENWGELIQGLWPNIFSPISYIDPVEYYSGDCRKQGYLAPLEFVFIDWEHDHQKNW